MKDSLSGTLAQVALAPKIVANNDAQIGAIIDRQGFRSLAFVIAIGAIADADAGFSVTVEHGNSADLSDGEAVPEAMLLGSDTDEGPLLASGFGAGAAGEARGIGYVGGKRYVRLTVTPANNADDAAFAVLALLGHGQIEPVALV